VSRIADSHGDWVLFRTSDVAAWPVYLQPDLAAKLLEEQRQRQIELVAISEAEAARKAKGKQGAGETSVAEFPPAREPERKLPRHPHAVTTHRVLVDVERVWDRLADLGKGAQGDTDHAKREAAVIKRALAFGPHRATTLLPCWRESLYELAQEMPAFGAAIDVVRNTCAINDASDTFAACPPILLVGPPGTGKSYFCRRLAECLDMSSAWLAFDQPSAGNQLCGSDRMWSTSQHGTLFELLALGDSANPLIVLDELDKAVRSYTSRDLDALAQLHSCLEPETSRRIKDLSLEVELDASLVTYIATANSIAKLEAPLLSRFAVVEVGMPSPGERREAARRVMNVTLSRLALEDRIRVRPGALVVLEGYSPRVIRRSVEQAVGAALAAGRTDVTVEDVEVALGLSPMPTRSQLH